MSIRPKVSTSSRITIHDVAKLAGVSPATVSKVLNNARHVSGDAQSRVLQAVTKLGYQPNSIARSLKVKSTRTIGLVTDDLEGVFTMPLMRGVEEAASAQGFSVFLCNSYGEWEKEKKHLEVLLNKQVDGVILLSGYQVRERSRPALPLGQVPLVYLYQYTRDVAISSVVPDDHGGATLGTEHLISLGYRRIGFINGPYNYEATHLRLEGYRQALGAAGLPFDPALVRNGEWQEDSGYELAQDLMRLPEPPDALFCTSDILAVGALDALHELGVRVPEDVAVLGFDNRPFAAHQRPPLTTVALPFYEMGKLAGELLIETVQGASPEATIHRVPCHLVPRMSCKASFGH